MNYVFIRKILVIFIKIKGHIYSDINSTIIKVREQNNLGGKKYTTAILKNI